MTLLLDPDIRDWVVLPLFVLIVVTGLLRQSVSQYMNVKKSAIPKVTQKTHHIHKQICKIKTPASTYITNPIARQQHAIEFLRTEADKIIEEKERQEQEGGEGGGTDSTDPMDAMFANPMSMLGGNMVFMVQNMVMMQGIQHFFSGFLLLRVPFPLTIGFKNMFQRGLDNMPDLEPSYTSSVSWYFLVLYGLRSFFKLMIGTPSLEQREQEHFLISIGLQNPPPPTSKNKQDPESMAQMLKQEADNIELLVLPKSEIDTVEKRLLGKRYPKKKLSRSADADFLLNTTSSTTKKNKNKTTKKKQ